MSNPFGNPGFPAAAPYPPQAAQPLVQTAQPGALAYLGGGAPAALPPGTQVPQGFAPGGGAQRGPVSINAFTQSTSLSVGIDQRVYFEIGNYTASVLGVKVFNHMGTDMFGADTKILVSDNPNIQPGMAISYGEKKGKHVDYWYRDIIRFLMAVTGHPAAAFEPTPANPRALANAMEFVCGESQPLKGREFHVRVTQKFDSKTGAVVLSKKGQPLKQYYWSPAQPPMTF